MSKREFKVGMKIKCVGPLGKDGYFANDDHHHGAVITGFPGGPGLLNIRFKWGGTAHGGIIHRRQVTKVIVPKKPCPPQGERVEFWVPLSENPMKISPLNSGMIGISRAALITGWRMVELKPGETILSRDKLAKAWDIVSAKSHGVSTCFGHLAEALGLGAK